MTERRLVVARGQRWGQGTNCEAAQQTFWGDRNVLELDGGGVYTALHICQNASNCTLKVVEFIEA